MHNFSLLTIHFELFCAVKILTAWTFRIFVTYVRVPKVVHDPSPVITSADGQDPATLTYYTPQVVLMTAFVKKETLLIVLEQSK